MNSSTNFDKLINSSLMPKRLSFDFLNKSATLDASQCSKKRKYSDVESHDQSKANESANDSLNSSSSLCAGWEMKLLRSDLIAAQTRIAQMKKEIQHQNTIQNEMELKFSLKEKSLENEKNVLSNKVTEYEKVIKKNRKNEHQVKEELLKIKNQLSVQKQSYDQQLFDMQNQHDRIKEDLNYRINDLNNTISELTRDNAELSSQLMTSEEEVESVKILNEDLKEKLEEFKTLKSDLEQEKVKHQEAERRCKELEYEVNSYGDWKDVAKASHSRMSTMGEMEKEVTRLRHTNRSIHDSLGNKLLLEEEVHNLTTRLTRYEKVNDEYITLKTQADSLEKDLIDWKNLGVDFVQKGSAPNPINVRAYIEKLLHQDLILMSEKTNVSFEKSSMNNQLGELKTQNDTYAKQIESLEKSLKTHQSVIQKLQKKMKLVQSERDAQRQMLDSYEKDTVTPGTQQTNAQETQFRLRIEMLSNSLAGYKELCTKLESEIAEIRGNPSNLSDPSYCTSEQYKVLRKDLETIRSENEKLRKRKNELEIEIENITLRSTVMEDERFKVLHFKNNPAAIAQEEASNEVAKLRAEVERLKIRNRKLEEGRDDVTSTVNATMNMTMNIKDMQKLRDENKTLAAKFEENESIFKRVNQELREVVYMLFGYKLDRYGNSNYRITSMYADDPNDELLFQMNDLGTLDMLESDYSKLLSGFMSQYLHGTNGSLPAFTSALTLELVNRMTVTTVAL